MKYEDFPKKCIKCKRSNIDLQKFYYGRSIGLESIKYVSIEFPVCESCGRQFKKYRKYEGFYDSAKYPAICIFIFVAFLMYFIYELYFYLYFLLAFLIIFLIIFVLAFLITFTHPNRISKYIRLKMNGRVIIKDPEYIQDIRNYTETRIAEDRHDYETGHNIIFCTKCGSKQKRGSDFCKVCGKELRGL